MALATTADWDFSYDAKGNIKSDKNKRITSIKYNHLNQPVEIKFNNNNNSVITYLYNASGQKVQKAVTQVPQGAQGAATTTTNYMNGFQYMNNVLQFFPTSEGYVRNTVVNEVNNYSYVYHYTDHLGNVRLSYAKDPATNVLKILEENHYYPYGVKHTNYNSNLNAFAGKMAGGIELVAVAATVPGGGGSTEQPYNYKFNGIEYQEELLLNMYDMPLRDYDPASAKWFNIDPVTHFNQSPFMAMNGNPVTFSDPSGADGHNWNPYSDMSMNNYGANGTSSPGRNSNGDNDGGSSIFWGSSRMLFEQSYEGRNGVFTTNDPSQIFGILSNYSYESGGRTITWSGKNIASGYELTTTIAASQRYGFVGSANTWDGAVENVTVGKRNNTASESVLAGGLTLTLATAEAPPASAGILLGTLFIYGGIQLYDSVHAVFEYAANFRNNFAQRGSNNGKLQEDELESILARKAAGTASSLDLQKLKKHEKNTGQRNSRQSKDKK